MDIPNVTNKVDEVPLINGDCFDEDLGTYFGALTDNSGNELTLPPVTLSIHINGVYYVYEVKRRYEEEIIKEEIINTDDFIKKGFDTKDL